MLQSSSSQVAFRHGRSHRTSACRSPRSTDGSQQRDDSDESAQCNDVVMDPIYRRRVLPEPPALCDEQVLLRSWSYNDLPCIEEASRDPEIPNRTTVPLLFSKEAGAPSWSDNGAAQLRGRALALLWQMPRQAQPSA
jgi:hypothetical protein